MELFLSEFQEIVDRFHQNIERVQNLVRLRDFVSREKSGNTDLQQGDDILRAALVFLHATLEDFLRSILAWKLPEAAPEEIDRIPLTGQSQKTPTKFNLGSLAAFKKLSIDELIRKSVRDHLEKWVSFNDLAQVDSALRTCGLDLGNFDYGTLNFIMSRRHNIVHHADAKSLDANDSPLSPISIGELDSAIAASRLFIDRISTEIQKSVYLPQSAVRSLLEYVEILAENGSVALKDYEEIFDLSRARSYKLRTDLLNMGFGSIDVSKKHILSNLERGESAVEIAQKFCRGHAVFRRIINDPSLSPKISQQQFVDIVIEVCGENFESQQNIESRAKKLLLLFWTVGFISQRGNEFMLLNSPSAVAAKATNLKNITRTRFRGLFFGDSPPGSLVSGIMKLSQRNVDRTEAEQLVGRNTVRTLFKLGLITSDHRPNTKTKIDTASANAIVREAALQDAVIKYCVDLVSGDPEIEGKEIGRLVAKEFNCAWIGQSQRRNGVALAGWVQWILGSSTQSKTQNNLRTPKQIANALRNLTPDMYGSLPLVAKKYSGKKGEPARGRPPAISENLFNAIKILREEYGLRNAEIAKRIGISRPTISRADKRYRG